MMVSDLIELLTDPTIVEVYSLDQEKTVYSGYSEELLYEYLSDYEVMSFEIDYDEKYRIPILIVNIE